MHMMDSGDHAVPFPDSYWVIPGRLLAGEYPASPYFEEETRRKVRQLLRAGVNYIVNLTEEGEAKPYEPALEEETAGAENACICQRFPIPDYTAPTPEHLEAILNAIDAALATGKTVYVHCLGGIGRTGTVVGAYLVRRGMSGEQALEMIRQLRHNTPDGWRPSPETEAQRNLILNWKTGK